MSGPDLQRFLDAQDGTYDQALAELRRGRKTGHWMWFVFPQLRGLGRSATAERYALDDLSEARGYLVHDVLGPRLLACCEALLDLETSSAEKVLGATDAMKLRSSMTLFHRADPSEPYVMDVLARFFGGETDDATDRLLG